MSELEQIKADINDTKAKLKKDEDEDEDEGDLIRRDRLEALLTEPQKEKNISLSQQQGNNPFIDFFIILFM
jgi:hypothetical protein